MNSIVLQLVEIELGKNKRRENKLSQVIFLKSECFKDALMQKKKFKYLQVMIASNQAADINFYKRKEVVLQMVIFEAANFKNIFASQENACISTFSSP